MSTTTTYTTFLMPMETPIGQLVLESDGDVLVGLWLPNASAGSRARRAPTRRPSLRRP